MKLVLVALMGLALAWPTSGHWFDNMLMYQVYPRSFQDTNNDGVGDIKGITSRLQYLKDSGVDSIWLSPVLKSPQKDNGYDISDFKDVDPLFGSRADLIELMQKAKEMGLRIIMDFVPNHTSNEHEWFIKSENNDPEYADFYIWRHGRNGGPPNNWVCYTGC
jgi:glycosidase